MWFRKEHWDCFTDDEIGERPFREVVRNYVNGVFQDGDLIRRAGTTEWRRIEEVEEIVEATARLKKRSQWRERWGLPKGWGARNKSRSGCLIALLGLLLFSACGAVSLSSTISVHDRTQQRKVSEPKVLPHSYATPWYQTASRLWQSRCGYLQRQSAVIGTGAPWGRRAAEDCTGTLENVSTRQFLGTASQFVKSFT